MRPYEYRSHDTTVLLVDDERTTRKIYRGRLEQEGYKVMECGSGREALSIFTEFRPDVILLDVIMADMDGFETCSIIRSLAGGQDVIVILITALQDDAFVDQAFRAGADDFVIKPVKWSVMMHRIAALVARREADIRRQLAEEKYRAVLENTSDWIFLTDEEGFFVYCSHACEALTGYSAEEFMDNRHLLLSIVAPGDLPAYVNHQIEEREMKCSDEKIFRINRRDGEERTIAHSCKPVLDEKGRLVAIRGSNRDISERIKAENQLRMAEKRLGDILDFLPDPTFVIDQDGRVILWNKAIERFTGVRSEDIVRKADRQYSMAITGERRPLVCDYFLDPELDLSQYYDIFHGDASRVEVEGWVQVPNAINAVYIWAQAVPLYDQNCRLVGVIESLRDITGIKRVENMLREQSQRLMVLNRIIIEANKSTSLRDTLDRTLQLILNSLGFEGGGIYLLEANNYLARIHSTHNLNPEFVKEMGLLDLREEAYLPLLKDHQAMFITDYAQVQPAHAAKSGFTSVASIPILAGEELVGLLNVASRQPRDFNEEEKETLVSIGQELGSLIISNQAKEAMRQSEERFRSLVEQSVDGIAIIDKNGRVIVWNRGMERILGISRDDAVDRDIWDLRAQVDPLIQTEEDKERYRRGMMRALETGTARWMNEYSDFSLVSRSGVIKQTQYTSFILKSSMGNMLGTIIRDITKTKDLEARLRFLGLHDSLTGLHNRAFFNEEMRRLEKPQNDPTAILVADLNSFKLLNDTLGHQAGDRLLVDVAGVLRNSFRENDVVARMGGDEFAVIINPADESQALAAIQRIDRAVEDYNQNMPPWPISISIGYAVRHGEELSLEEIYRRADTMMYHNKTLTKSRGNR